MRYVCTCSELLVKGVDASIYYRDAAHFCMGYILYIRNMTCFKVIISLQAAFTFISWAFSISKHPIYAARIHDLTHILHHYHARLCSHYVGLIIGINHVDLTCLTFSSTLNIFILICHLIQC